MDGSGQRSFKGQISDLRCDCTAWAARLRIALRSSVYSTTVLQELTWDVPNTIHIKWLVKIRD